MSMTLFMRKVYPTATWCQQNWYLSHLCFQRFISSHPRYNSVNIQMLSESLHRQIFKNAPESTVSAEALKVIQAHLQKHGLAGKTTTTLPDADLKLPQLYGDNINEHFVQIANKQLNDYRLLIDEIISRPLPKMPDTWQRTSGWSKYLENGTCESVPFPNDRGLIFDVECLLSEGNYPTMATAVSARHWYSWVSDYVLEDKFRQTKTPQLKDLIPLETKPGTVTPPGGKWQPHLIIGHNVGFDRSYVKEQYFIQSEALKKISSLNNLRDVHQLHCGGEPIEKAMKDVFVEGSMRDVRDQFQDLMAYCANDVRATHAVFLKLWPEFKERFPHPVTLAGMLEMGSAYLPINDAWPRYIQHANSTFAELEMELKKLLMALANEACTLFHDEEYKNDPWLWDLDWSTSTYRLNKTGNNVENIVDPFEKEEAGDNKYPNYMEYVEGKKAYEEYKKVIRRVWATAARVPKKPVFMSGFPKWYKELCPRPKDDDFYPGPSRISTKSRITPKLMRLTWDGYPVHYDDKHGWGYLVPHEEELTPLEVELRNQETDYQEQHKFPLQSFLAFVHNNKAQRHGSLPSANGVVGPSDTVGSLGRNFGESAMEEEMPLWEKIVPQHVGVGPFDIGIPGVQFYRIPHEKAGDTKVVSPLTKEFLLKVEDGTLTASTGTQADRALILGRMCFYWRINQKQIMGQMSVWLNKSELDKNITYHPDYKNEGLYGAIVPRIITAGTISRRAVESTWLLASNPDENKVGSEIKAMIHSPPGYKFVGADVDSQELWIAAILGDSYFKKEHGCTGLGFQILQGDKVNKTDLHSKTAQYFKISRDHAKVMNYAYIFGAGVTLAAKQLMYFNPQLSEQEAKKKVADMHRQTRGQLNPQGKWIGGTGSFMLNAVESTACSKKPMTPVLGGRISKTLEPPYGFIATRRSWVVQSSAVDYLHLMLVCMRWLLTSYNIKGRLSISIHDDVRYLVQSSDCYSAALALQITNLLTCCMFSYKLGMNDLPQSVAFFSAVDVDGCLRKEVTMNCVTPSNPHGLQQGYSVPPGESLDIYEIVKKTGGKL